jgi:hypothetical protein
MAIAFLRGTVTRTPYFQPGETTPFAATTLKETYVDRSGEERNAGFHDLLAFGAHAEILAALPVGANVEVKANIRYRADKRYRHVDEPDRNPFMAQFVVMDFINYDNGAKVSKEEDPFA